MDANDELRTIMADLPLTIQFAAKLLNVTDNKISSWCAGMKSELFEPMPHHSIMELKISLGILKHRNICVKNVNP